MSDGGIFADSGGESPAAGWYTDPGGSGGERYWDGTRWTDQTRPAGGSQSAAPTSAFGDPLPPYGQPAPGFQPPPVPYQPVPQAHASAKSPALAIVLTFLWLGAGHFYAGRSDTTAILLAVGNAVLWLLFLMCFIGILGWIPLVIWAAVDARRSALDFNRRHGVSTPT